MTYHYSHNYQPVGPVTREHLKELFQKGLITIDTPVLSEGATQWTPYRTLDSAPKDPLTTLTTPLAGVGALVPAIPPPPGPPPPGPPPLTRPSVSSSAAKIPKSHYKALVLISWLLLGGTAIISVIPFIGFATWLIAIPVFITTLVLGILTLSRGGTLNGVLILLATFIAVPLFILIAPIVTTSIVGSVSNKAKQASTFKIKGLYIGMKISEARDIFNGQFAAAIGDKLIVVKNPNGGLMLRPDKPGAEDPMNMFMEAVARSPVPLVKADSGGVVTFIGIPSSLGDKLFNTTDLDADSFAQQFIDSYGVPELKPFYERSGFGNVHNTEQGWEYRSPAGFKLRVHSDKSVEIEGTPKESDRQFD